MIKEILNIDFQQFTIDVKFFNVQMISFNTCFLNVSNLKKKFKNEKMIFVKVDAVKQ